VEREGSEARSEGKQPTNCVGTRCLSSIRAAAACRADIEGTDKERMVDRHVIHEMLELGKGRYGDRLGEGAVNQHHWVPRMARAKTYAVYGGQAEGTFVMGGQGEGQEGVDVEELGDCELYLRWEGGPGGRGRGEHGWGRRRGRGRQGQRQLQDRRGKLIYVRTIICGEEIESMATD
jgi:hypothetical protein